MDRQCDRHFFFAVHIKSQVVELDRLSAEEAKIPFPLAVECFASRSTLRLISAALRIRRIRGQTSDHPPPRGHSEG